MQNFEDPAAIMARLTPDPAPMGLLGFGARKALDGLSTAGYVLDSLGRPVRRALRGTNPFGNDDPRGRDVLESWGIVGPETGEWDVGDFAGFGVELVTDPLNYLLPGAHTLHGFNIARRGSLAAKAAKAAQSKADDLARAAAGYVDDAATEWRMGAESAAETAAQQADEAAKVAARSQLKETLPERIRTGQSGLFGIGIPVIGGNGWEAVDKYRYVVGAGNEGVADAVQKYWTDPLNYVFKENPVAASLGGLFRPKVMNATTRAGAEMGEEVSRRAGEAVQPATAEAHQRYRQYEDLGKGLGGQAAPQAAQQSEPQDIYATIDGMLRSGADRASVAAVISDAVRMGDIDRFEGARLLDDLPGDTFTPARPAPTRQVQRSMPEDAEPEWGEWTPDEPRQQTPQTPQGGPTLRFQPTDRDEDLLGGIPIINPSNKPTGTVADLRALFEKHGGNAKAAVQEFADTFGLWEDDVGPAIDALLGDPTLPEVGQGPFAGSGPAPASRAPASGARPRFADEPAPEMEIISPSARVPTAADFQSAPAPKEDIPSADILKEVFKRGAPGEVDKARLDAALAQLDLTETVEGGQTLGDYLKNRFPGIYEGQISEPAMRHLERMVEYTKRAGDIAGDIEPEVDALGQAYAASKARDWDRLVPSSAPEGADDVFTKASIEGFSELSPIKGMKGEGQITPEEISALRKPLPEPSIERSYNPETGTYSAKLVQQLKEAIPTLDDEKIRTSFAAADAVADTLAKRAGISKDAWWEARVGGIVRGPDGIDAKGMVALGTGAAIVTALQKADVTTFLHEFAHIIRPELTKAENAALRVFESTLNAYDKHILNDALQITGVTADIASVKAALLNGTDDADMLRLLDTYRNEKFARGFEQYLRNGVAPTPELASLFAKLKEWITRVYIKIKTRLGSAIPEDARRVYDGLFSGKPLDVDEGFFKPATPVSGARETLEAVGDVSQQTDVYQQVDDLLRGGAGRDAVASVINDAVRAGEIDRFAGARLIESLPEDAFHPAAPSFTQPVSHATPPTTAAPARQPATLPGLTGTARIREIKQRLKELAPNLKGNPEAVQEYNALTKEMSDLLQAPSLNRPVSRGAVQQPATAQPAATRPAQPAITSRARAGDVVSPDPTPAEVAAAETRGPLEKLAAGEITHEQAAKMVAAAKETGETGVPPKTPAPPAPPEGGGAAGGGGTNPPEIPEFRHLPISFRGILRKMVERVQLTPAEEALIANKRGAIDDFVEQLRADDEELGKLAMDLGVRNAELKDIIEHFARFHVSPSGRSPRVMEARTGIWDYIKTHLGWRQGKRAAATTIVPPRKDYLKGWVGGTEDINEALYNFGGEKTNDQILAWIRSRMDEESLDDAHVNKIARWLAEDKHKVYRGNAGQLYFGRDVVNDLHEYKQRAIRAIIGGQVIHRAFAENAAEGAGVPLLKAFQAAGIDIKNQDRLLQTFFRNNADILAGKDLSKLEVPEDIVAAAARMIKPMEDPEVLKPLLSVIDQATGATKIALTILWPANWVRNAIGGQYMNLIRGAIDPQSLREAAAIVLGYGDEAILRELSEVGLLDPSGYRGFGSTFSGDLRDIGKESVTWWQQRKAHSNRLKEEADYLPMLFREWAAMGHASAGSVELWNRITHYLAKKRQGFAPIEAAKSTKLAHYDYGAGLTDFEKKYVRRMLPFYSFAKLNAIAMFDELTSKPGGIAANTIKAAASANKDSELPPWLEGKMAFPIGQSEDGKSMRYVSALGLPVEEALERYFPGDLQRTLQAHASMLHPFIRGPLEYTAGKQFFSGKELSDLYQYPTNSLALNQLISSSPLSRGVSTVRQLTDERKGLGAKALNTLTGVKVTDVDVEAARKISEREALLDYLAQSPAFQTRRIYTQRPGTQLTPQEEAAFREYKRR